MAQRLSKTRTFLVAGWLGLLTVDVAYAACEASVWRDYQGTKLWRVTSSGAYFYATSRMDIDADGAPNAYHPQDLGIDALGNAGYPRGGWRSVLVVDPRDAAKPYVQTTGEFAGYFVSKTSLQDKTLAETDPRRYVDARTIPYIVFPGDFYRISGTGDYGDLALARNLSNQMQSSAVVADGGPASAPLGEVSIGLAENLGGSHVNPRTGAGQPRGTFVYAVFPHSRRLPPWPATTAQMDQRASDLLAAFGGWDKILNCLR